MRLPERLVKRELGKLISARSKLSLPIFNLDILAPSVQLVPNKQRIAERALNPFFLDKNLTLEQVAAFRVQSSAILYRFPTIFHQLIKARG